MLLSESIYNMNKYIAIVENNTLTLYFFHTEKNITITYIESDAGLKSLMKENNLQSYSVHPLSDLNKDDSCPDYLFVKDKDCYRKIYFRQILWLEAAGSYCFIQAINNVKLCLTFSLSEIMTKLPEDQFLRTHRSYIVNINHVDSFIGNMMCIHRYPHIHVIGR